MLENPFDQFANHANKTVANMCKTGDIEQINHLIQANNSDWEDPGKTSIENKDPVTAILGDEGFICLCVGEILSDT